MWPLIIAAAGAATTIMGQRKAAKEEARRSNFLAAQFEQDAGQLQASSQRTAEDQRRQAQLVASRAIALAGGGATDPSVVKTISDISAEGELRALTALYGGDSEAQSMRERAAARVFEGAQYSRSSQLAMAGTIFKTGSSLYSKYGGGFSESGSAPSSGYLDAGTSTRSDVA